MRSRSAGPGWILKSLRFTGQEALPFSPLQETTHMAADIGGIGPNTISTAAPRRRQRRAKLFLAHVPRWKTRPAVPLFYWFGPETVKFRELDSFLQSRVQMAP